MPKKKEKTKLGWHVLPESGEIGIGWNGDRRKPRVGQWLRYRGANNQPTFRPPKVCIRGLHAWNSLRRAIRTAKNQTQHDGNLWTYNNEEKQKCWLCRVMIRGSIDFHAWDYPNNKFAGEERKIIWKILLTKKEITHCIILLKREKNGVKALNREIHRLKRKQGK